MQSWHRAPKSRSARIGPGIGPPRGHQSRHGFAVIGDQNFPSLAYNFNEFGNVLARFSDSCLLHRLDCATCSTICQSFQRARINRPENVDDFVPLISESDNGGCIFLIPKLYVLYDEYVMTVRMVWTWKGYHDTP